MRHCLHLTSTFVLIFLVTVQSQMLGGHKNIADHQNDARVQEVAQFAVKQIGEKTSKKLDLVKINSAQKQVVAGLNYVLVIETAAQSKKETYEAHVYEPLGNQPLKLTSHKQIDNEAAQRKTEESSERHSGALLGGYREVSTTDSEVSQAADFAAEQLSSQSNSLSPLKVEEVLSARSKVAAGKVFELKMKLSQGNMPEQIMQVEVSRSLQNELKLESHNPISSES
uniref:Putative extracellular protein TR9_044 n=1 Tax=Trebouxia lynnae TaxID=1825957 RepID=A0A7L9QEI0_9CHLO|nr:putative extracellular protein TR9_044 [Trebouxia lynnae]